METKTLADYYDFSDADIFARAERFSGFLKYIDENKHGNYKRVSTNGSQPMRKVEDPYRSVIREMVNLSGNDYLNLTNHPKVKEAGMEAVKKYGAGAGSVPLLGGETDLHTELEKQIAAFKSCEKAIIYTSGYTANCSSLLAMLTKSDIAIVDQLAHASLVDGCKNTNSKYFSHNDTDALARILHMVKDKYRTKLVIIDGVYSMDGDIAPLALIIQIAKQYGAYVMVDEAHATGVIGLTGKGTPEYCDVMGEVDIVSGTFSKALGGVGGFVASKGELVDLLHFYSRGYMFSTAMTPQTAGSVLAALEVIAHEPERRQRLWSNIEFFKKGLLELGFDIGNSQTAIFPIIIGDDFLTKEICRELHELNIYANFVVFPAVSKKRSRIRMSLMAEHTKEQLGNVLDVMGFLGKKHKLIS